MCRFTIDLLDYDQLTDAQKKNSLETTTGRKKSSSIAA